MSNLIAGCAINNTIDNVVRGTFLTTIEQIDIAIERLTDLKYLLNYNDYQRKKAIERHIAAVSQVISIGEANDLKITAAIRRGNHYGSR